MLYGRMDFHLVKWVGQISDIFLKLIQLSNRCQNFCAMDKLS